MARYLVISGVSVSGIPVLSNFIAWAKARGNVVKVLEYSGGSRVVFVARALVMAFRLRKDTVVFCNTQSAVVLRMLQLARVKLANAVYWAFESVTGAKPWSPIWLGTLAERSLGVSDVRLVVPIEERRAFFSPNFRSVDVFENVPLRGIPFVPREIRAGERVRLVFYGGLSPKITYATEFLLLARSFPSLYELTLIGDHSCIDVERWGAENINFVGRLSHEGLIRCLREGFHYSLVGYRPVLFNYKYCAPNKLFESFSLSLPVIGNIGNPTIARILEQETGGVLADFEGMDGERLYGELVDGYRDRVLAAYSAYSDRYNFDSIAGRVTCFNAA